MCTRSQAARGLTSAVERTTGRGGESGAASTLVFPLTIALSATALLTLGSAPARGEELRFGRSLFAAASASGEANVIFGEKTAQVGGVKPGGGLFWLTAWRERVDHAWTRVQRKLGFAPDTDADGVVEIELTEKIPTLSTWIVVDLNTSSLDVDLAEAQKFDGQSFDVVAPSAFEVRPMTVEMKEEGEATSHFEVLGADIEVVWLRPQVGAWRARILDGGAADLDGIGDRRLRFDASAFQAVFPERLDPPEAPQAGDVLLGIEANSLRAFVAQVEK